RRSIWVICRRRRKAREGNRHSHPLPGARLDREVSLGVLAQRSHDECAKLARLRPLNAFWKADAIIGNNDAAMIAIRETLQRYRATVTADECMLERVCQKFIYHQSGRHGYVHRNRKRVDLEIEPSSFYPIRVKHRRGDVA